MINPITPAVVSRVLIPLFARKPNCKEAYYRLPAGELARLSTLPKNCIKLYLAVWSYMEARTAVQHGERGLLKCKTRELRTRSNLGCRAAFARALDRLETEGFIKILSRQPNGNGHLRLFIKQAVEVTNKDYVLLPVVLQVIFQDRRCWPI